MTYLRSARTRAELRAASLRHFVAHGFEGASVAAIAAEVGVTERTFYRHFATKEEVLLEDVGEAFAWFARALHERPAEEDLVASVLAALGSGPTDLEVLGEVARLRVDLLGADRLDRVVRDRQAAVAREVRSLLTVRGVPDLDAAVRAETVAGAIFAALRVWTEAPPPHDLRDLHRLTAEALDRVRSVVDHAPTPATAPDRPRTARG